MPVDLRAGEEIGYLVELADQGLDSGAGVEASQIFRRKKYDNSRSVDYSEAIGPIPCRNECDRQPDQ